MSTEQENIELREEVSNLKVGLEKLTIMMEVMMAERERAEVSEPIPTVVVSTPQPTPAAAGTTQPVVVGSSVDDMYNENFRPPGPQSFNFNPCMTCQKVTHGVCHI
jgi:hypothetical protein